MPDSVSQDDVSTLVERLEDAASAYMRGDMERYLELVHHARGFTLLAPGGGPPVSYENRADGVRASVGFFKGGESRLENVEVHAWDDTVVVALIERQHGEVGGLPDQDWSLRVTQVFRRVDAGWQLVHRHADPLVHPLPPELAAALARGEGGDWHPSR
jgi:ketosteroid isomerase-like protein